ncbi:MAG: exonuclease domain-containing protein [Caulobacter sp.]|nr:exonuclease domain-containing protein [Caulobacter sp.]
MAEHIIRVIDFETTGMEPPHEVCEVGYCDLIKTADGWAVDPPVSWLCGVRSIPPEVRAIHHITMAEVAGLEPFDPAAFFGEEGGAAAAVIAAHNMEFEAKFLGAHAVPTLCTYKAALRVWPEAPGHSNGVLRYWLEDQGLLSLDHHTAMPPHRAGPDAYVTAHILKALLTRATAREMVGWTREPRLLPTCPIGKFRGKPWSEVEAGFLNWMLGQPTMEADLKWNAQRELDRRAA